jgi:hypothetical protein
VCLGVSRSPELQQVVRGVFAVVHKEPALTVWQVASDYLVPLGLSLEVIRLKSRIRPVITRAIPGLSGSRMILTWRLEDMVPRLVELRQSNAIPYDVD